MTDPGPLQVIGGAGGLAAEYAALSAAAGALQGAADDLLATADAARGVLTAGPVVASAALDPLGFARVEAAVLAAVGGPHGLLLSAVRLEERALAMRAAVLRYQAADELAGDLRGVRHWVEGATAAALLPLAVVGAGPPLLLLGGTALLAPGRSSRRIDALLADHPGAVEEAAGAAPAFVGTLTTLALGPAVLVADGAFRRRTGHPLVAHSLEEATGLMALLYPPGAARVAGRGTDTSAAATTVPRGVGDLLAGLAHRDARAAGDAQGEIDVRRVSWAGHTSWVVDLPGTKDWQLDPRSRQHLNDLATNLTTMAGEPSPRVDGVTRALALAGVGRDDPVVLVGHSQGGLVALRAAEQYTASGAYRVTHVVTAGSPVARMPVPPGVQLLSLENRDDIVPRLDGDPPPDQVDRTTVLFDAQHHDVGLNHAIATTYLPAGREVDATAGASLDAWRRSTAAVLPPAGVPAQVRTTVWDIRNGG